MQVAATPINEELRLQDLYSYDILDSASEKEFDDLLEVAAKIYGCPIAAVTFIDKDRQWLKAKKGIDPDVTETTRDISFCSHTILEQEVMIVSDATMDKRFSENPVVTDGLKIRFYAGAPIVSKAGYKLGAVCVIDSQPRELTQEEAKTLTIISQQIAKLLELRLKNKMLLQRAEEQQRLDRELMLKTLQIHENEKFSISFELHENIAQSLAATKFYLEMAETTNLSKDEMIQKSKECITGIIKQVQQLSAAISPTTLKQYHLKELLEELLLRFYTKTTIEATLLYEGQEELQPELALSVYRIVEEQLANVKQHTGATKIQVTVNALQKVHISVKDNSVNLDEHKFIKGGGLQRIHSRVEAYGGNVSFSRSAKNGCNLSVTI